MNLKLRLKFSDIKKWVEDKPLRAIGWAIVLINGLHAVYKVVVGDYSNAGIDIGVGLVWIMILDRL